MAADAWVRGGEDQLDLIMANGMTSPMGLWTQMRAHLEWMRQHNRAAARPVGFYGIDMPGSMVSLLPGLDTVTAYLAQAWRARERREAAEREEALRRADEDDEPATYGIPARPGPPASPPACRTRRRSA